MGGCYLQRFDYRFDKNFEGVDGKLGSRGRKNLGVVVVVSGGTRTEILGVGEQ